MSRPTVSYTIPPHVTLEEIADAGCVTIMSLKTQNPILEERAENNIAGLTIQITQTNVGRFNNIDIPMYTEEQLKQRLDDLTNRAQRRARQAESSQHVPPTQVVASSPCTEKIYDLLHVSRQGQNGKKEHMLVMLTKSESEQFAQEAQQIQNAIETFNNTIAAIPETASPAEVKTVKTQAFQTLMNTVPEAFIAGHCNIDPKTQEKIPTGPEDPTKIVEVRQLGTIPTTPGANAVDEIPIQTPQSTTTSSQPITTNPDDADIADPPLKGIPLQSAVVFNYVKGDSLKKVIEDRSRVYIIPPEGTARQSWWNHNENKINTARLKEELQRVRNTEFDKALEFKIQMEPITFFNNNAHEWKDETTWPLEHLGAEIKVTREAQVFRYAASASAEAGYDALTKTAALSAKINAEFDLIRGKASLKSEFPRGENAHLKFALRNNQSIDFGYFHLATEIIVFGFAGASALAGADIQIDFSKGYPQIKSTTPYNDKARVGVEAFAGVKAGCEVKGGFEWIDTLEPQAGNTDTKWKTLAEASIMGEIAAGIGGVGKFYIRFQNGTFTIMFHAGLVYGVGASGKIGGTVRLDNICVMVHFVYNSLMKADYSYLDFMDPDAFGQMVALGLGLLIKGASWAIEITVDTIKATASIITGWINGLNEFFTGWSEEKAAELAVHVLHDLDTDVTPKERSIILHLAPEGKGQLLYKLLYINWPEFWFETPDDEPLEAVIVLMRTIQSSQELRQVFACMNAQGIPDHSKEDTNFEQLMKYLKGYPLAQSEIRQQRSRLQEQELNAAIENLKETVLNLLNSDIAPIPDKPVTEDLVLNRASFSRLAKATNYQYFV